MGKNFMISTFMTKSCKIKLRIIFKRFQNHLQILGSIVKVIVGYEDYIGITVVNGGISVAA